MKRSFKAAFAAALALMMALAAIPVSALPELESEAAKAEVTPCWTVPDGFNAHDYEKCVNFLEQTDENGVKNGEKLSSDYDPSDPHTWGTDTWAGVFFQWSFWGEEERIRMISVPGKSLCGVLDLSGCTDLEVLFYSANNIVEQDVTGCTALEYLDCANNDLGELDVSSNTALTWLNCSNNDIGALDVSSNTALDKLYCNGNAFSELDLSSNTMLAELYCYDNAVTELDLRNNPRLPYDFICSDGSGFVGYVNQSYNEIGYLLAYPQQDAVFEGFFDENGAELESEYSNSYRCYICEFEGDHSGMVTARFSGGAVTPGDLDGSGSVTTADAIMTLRLAMQLTDGSGMNLDAADMDGNGSITLADAIIILRTAMGLA